MAYWVVGGGSPPSDTEQHPQPQLQPHHLNLNHHNSNHHQPQLTFVPGGKRRVSGTTHDDYYHEHYDQRGQLQQALQHQHHHQHDSASKRARLEDWGGAMDQHFQHPYHDHRPYTDYTDKSDNVRVRKIAFIIIHEHQAPEEKDPTPPPPPPTALSSISMERTESGLSISSDNTAYDTEDDDQNSPGSSHLLSDLEAARFVRSHVCRYRPDSQPERILKSLIRPRHDFPLDNDALSSIFSAANELFFANRLSRRVAWDWSHSESQEWYAEHVVGTTALRRSAKLGGYETLIVLSSPILRDTKYNRRLLISTFLHEMIHSFLFVMCGLKARKCGGHTPGFRQIAETIDAWVGREYLRLGDMEADLERFRGDNCNHNTKTVPAVPTPPPSSMQLTLPETTTQRRECRWDGDYRRGHYEYEEWQWYEQEGFRTRGGNAGSSSYVQ